MIQAQKMWDHQVGQKYPSGRSENGGKRLQSKDLLGPVTGGLNEQEQSETALSRSVELVLAKRERRAERGLKIGVVERDTLPLIHIGRVATHTRRTAAVTRMRRCPRQRRHTHLKQIEAVLFWTDANPFGPSPFRTPL